MRKQIGIWLSDLDWFFRHADTECGERSNMGSFLARMDRGGSSSQFDGEAYTDAQLGFGPRWHGRGSVARARRIGHVWQRLPRRHQLVLRYYYAPPTRLPVGSDARLGRGAAVAYLLATDAGALADACQSGSDAVLGPARAASESAVKAAHSAFEAIQSTEWLEGRCA